MTPSKKTRKAVDCLLTISFAIVLITGIMLHLKAHGILIQPRGVLKAVHYGFGFLMTGCAAVHIGAYFKWLRPMRRQHAFFVADTWALLVLLAAVVITGIVKLASPVRIPGLGLWHYWLGMAMSLTALLHLRTAFPYLLQRK